MNIGSPCIVAAGAQPSGQVNACDASSAEPPLKLCGRPSAFRERESMVEWTWGPAFVWWNCLKRAQFGLCLPLIISLADSVESSSPGLHTR